MTDILFLKSHNSGYTRKDGAYVAPFDDSRTAKPQKVKAPQLGLPGGMALFGAKPMKPALPKSSVKHPKLDENGKPMMIHYPSQASDSSAWGDGEMVATWTPGSEVPMGMNGVDFAPWEDHPRSTEAWDYVDGQVEDMDEPMLEVPHGKIPASGVVCMEPDGRVWIVSPTNQFAGSKNTFPKGGCDRGLSLQANAIKEAYEESGLKVEIVSLLGDVERSMSMTRYYLARRVGGSPAAMGWESQAVRLAPQEELLALLNKKEDQKVGAWVQGLSVDIA